MPKALRIILVIQVLLGVVWTSAMLTELQKSLASLYLFVLIYPFHLVFALVAVWAIWKHPDLRRKAVLVFVLPVGFLFLPYLVTSLFGGALHGEQLAGLAVAAGVLGVVISFALPKKTVKVLPNCVFRSRGFNILVIAIMVVAWLIPLAAIIWLAQQSGTSQPGGGQGSPGMGAAFLLLGAAMYFVGLGAASIMTAVLGWLGLRGDVVGAQRKLHSAQLAIAAPGVLLGSGTLAWLLTQAG
jgi:hypothetical protein